MILLCHPRFPSSHPGSSVMAKLMNSLPAFERSGAGPDYLCFSPSLWTPVSKVLHLSKPWPWFFVGLRTLVVFLQLLLCLRALRRAVLVPSLCPLSPDARHRMCLHSVIGVLCTTAHPGKQLSGRKCLLLPSKFHEAVPFLAAQ